MSEAALQQDSTGEPAAVSLHPSHSPSGEPAATMPPPPPPSGYRKVKRRLSVGRNPNSDIVVDDGHTSRTAMYILLYEDMDDVATLLDTHSETGIALMRGGGFERISGQIDVGLDDPIRIGVTNTTVRKLLRGGAETPDVFISYAREDQAAAIAVEKSLQDAGWNIWRDDRLGVARAFDEEIETRLMKARCVVVLWSARSIASQWVRAEASVALDRGVLVPVFIADVAPPVLFRQIQGCTFMAVDGTEFAAQRKVLVDKIEQLIGRRT